MSEKNPHILTRLFHLLLVLSPSQKKAFKRDARYWSDNIKGSDYVLFFDQLNDLTMGNIQEEELLPKLYELRIDKRFRTNIKTADQLKVYKDLCQKVKKDVASLSSYVYQKILSSMRFIPDSSEGFVTLNSLMQDAYFLLNKSLYADTLILIQEARDLAQELDHQTYILELCRLERRVRSRMLHGVEDSIFEQQMFQIEARALKQIELTNEFQSLTSNVRKNIKNNSQLTESTEHQINDLIRLYPETRMEDLLPRTKYHFFLLKAAYFSYCSEIKKKSPENNINYFHLAYEAQSSLVSVFEEFKSLKQEEIWTYYNALDGFCIKCLQLRQFDLAESKIIILENAADTLVRYRSGNFIRLQLFTGKGNFEAARKYIEDRKLVQHWPALRDQFWPTRLVSGYWICMMTYFILKKYEEADQWSKLIIQETKDGQMPHFRLMAQLVAIIADAETNVQHEPVLRFASVRLAHQHQDTGYQQFVENLIDLLSEICASDYSRQRQALEQRLETFAQTIQAQPRFNLFAYFAAWMLAELKGTAPVREMARFG